MIPGMNPNVTHTEQNNDAIAKIEYPVAEGAGAAAVPAAPVCPPDAISQSDGFGAGGDFSASPADGPGAARVESALGAEDGGGSCGLDGAADWPNRTNTGGGTGPGAGAATGTVNGLWQAGQMICVPL
jgi:hypothetical protein